MSEDRRTQKGSIVNGVNFNNPTYKRITDGGVIKQL